jgi:hypothetical protein
MFVGAGLANIYASDKNFFSKPAPTGITIVRRISYKIGKGTESIDAIKSMPTIEDIFLS